VVGGWRPWSRSLRVNKLMAAPVCEQTAGVAVVRKNRKPFEKSTLRKRLLPRLRASTQVGVSPVQDTIGSGPRSLVYPSSTMERMAEKGSHGIQR
jgi:hypothetical protein